MRVLVVEDEDRLREQLVQFLETEGFVVDASADGGEAEYLGLEYPYDAAVVDIGLPGKSGNEVVAAWRAQGRSVPVLILTARGGWQDKVAALEGGADDYLVKPFHMQELLARIRALVRRAAGWSQSVFHCGPLTLDTGAQSVTMDGAPVELTAYEYKVLEYLVHHAGEVVSKSELTEHIYAQDYDRDSNVIEVFVGRLRRKLDPGDQLGLIETLRGRGYRFTIKPGQG